MIKTAIKFLTEPKEINLSPMESIGVIWASLAVVDYGFIYGAATFIGLCLVNWALRKLGEKL